MEKVSDWMVRVSSGWVVLLGLAVFLLFSALVLPGQAARAEDYSGEIGSPDTSLFYTAGDLYAFAERYGAAGRAEYIRARFTFDRVWPLVYGLFLVTATSWLFARAGLRGSRWMRLNLLPAAGVAFDYLENISAVVVMARYPQPTLLLDHLAGVFTLVKWVCIAASFAVLLPGAFLAVRRIWMGRKGR